ncbi:predicted protein [Plenodomus lingam JN3]|uniref:Predicted protein n=1 Tax=Leptosphaeria maculans (strain JN3 / isolate v23.1.3 / race Av1-4-5-6-7-8) TaxID=985895 RepID=E5A4I9_LEPMJ|nr:predicted protein [Plenodomus lingam JN3]CBX98537.1 predicted protein [Plenodomus lingam JN3]
MGASISLCACTTFLFLAPSNVQDRSRRTTKIFICMSFESRP